MRIPYLVALATLLAGVFALRTLAHGQVIPLRQPLQQLPLRLGEWEGRTDFFEPGVLSALGVDDYVVRRYRDSSGSVLWLYVGYYVSQRLSDRIHSPRVCLPGAGWAITEIAPQPIRLADREIIVNRAVVQKGDQRQVVLYWYQMRGQVVARDLEATARLAWGALSQRRTDEALVRVNAPVVGSLDDTLRREVAFVQRVFPLLDRHLPK